MKKITTCLCSKKCYFFFIYVIYLDATWFFFLWQICGFQNRGNITSAELTDLTTIGNIWVIALNFSERVLNLMVTESGFSNKIYNLYNYIYDFRCRGTFPIQSLLSIYWFCWSSFQNNSKKTFSKRPSCVPYIGAHKGE